MCPFVVCVKWLAIFLLWTFVCLSIFLILQNRQHCQADFSKKKHFQVFMKCERDIHIWENAKMYIEFNKIGIFLSILNKKGTLCHQTSLNQTYRNVLESEQRMRQLPILTQTFVPDIAARWKMRKCTGRRLKCWIQTKIFIKYQ